MSNNAEIASWFTGRLPAEWFVGAPEITVDRDEILVVGHIATPSLDQDAVTASTDHAAYEGRISRFREDTRGQRMGIADQTQDKFGRKVSWGAACGDLTVLFTHVTAPVMTRLRQPERRVLDVLVEAGVAKSRSEAVAWCVRLVGEHEGTWIAELHDALAAVREARTSGPQSRRVG